MTGTVVKIGIRHNNSGENSFEPFRACGKGKHPQKNVTVRGTKGSAKSSFRRQRNVMHSSADHVLRNMPSSRLGTYERFRGTRYLLPATYTTTARLCCFAHETKSVVHTITTNLELKPRFRQMPSLHGPFGGHSALCALALPSCSPPKSPNDKPRPGELIQVMPRSWFGLSRARIGRKKFLGHADLSFAQPLQVCT